MPSKKNSMRNIVSAFENADLETEQYKSGSLIKSLSKYGHLEKTGGRGSGSAEHEIPTRRRNVKQRLLDGQPDPLNPDEYDVYPRKNGWVYKGFQMETAITDTEDQCPYACYEYIYGEYRSNPELQSLYQKYPRTSSMFRSVDRVKLIMSILKCDP